MMTVNLDKPFKYNSRADFINNSTLRCNVLMWYPFKKSATILYLGNTLAIKKYLKKRYQVDSDNKIDESLNKKYDYIIIEGLLDNRKHKQNIISHMMHYLNAGGSMLILANNKYGIQYLSGNCNEHVADYCLSRKEWNAVLDKLNAEYKIIYPYPSYQFTEKIFFEAPKPSEISEYHQYSALKVKYFDETASLRRATKAGYFEDINDAFMIIINGQFSDQYIKFARERIDSLQIYTTIKKDGNKLVVQKAPIYEKGMAHLKHINQFASQFNKSMSDSSITYCQSYLNNEGLSFEYIAGKSLEELVQESINDESLDIIYQYLDLIKKIIENSPKTTPAITKDFIEVFGKQELSQLPASHWYDKNNIDLIFENILYDGNYHVIDYEWIFDFPIPESFILFRVLFHSTAISQLNDEIKNVLYDYCNISDSLKALYLNMEINFQNYVSDYQINNIVQELNLEAVYAALDENRLKRIYIASDEYEKNIIIKDNNEINLTVLIKNDDRVTIELAEKCCLRVDELSCDQGNIQIESNADLVIGNHYYFTNKPKFIIIGLSGAKALFFKSYAYFYGNDALDEIVRLIQENASLSEALESRKSILQRIFKK